MPTGPPVMVRGEAVWAIVCATLRSDARAKMPEPDDEPTPEDDDESDDEPKDDRDDESEDERDDESEDEPGTLYFGQDDRRPDPAKVHHHAPADTAGRAESIAL